MPQSLTTKQQYWSTHLQKAEAFDGSFADYARAQGLPEQALYRWRHQLKQLGVNQVESKTVFTQVVSSAVHSGPSLTLETNEVQLRFARLPDPHWLAQLLAMRQRR